MVSTDSFRQAALAFEKAVEQPHFEKPSFRVGKKIFATLNQPARRATLKLSAIDQSVFCSFDAAIIYPAAGAWGKGGWTIVELQRIKLSECEEEAGQFILRIEWTSTEEHLNGFRKSKDFPPFFACAKPYFDNILEMRHYRPTEVVHRK